MIKRTLFLSADHSAAYSAREFVRSWPVSEVRERPLLERATGSNGSVAAVGECLGAAVRATIARITMRRG